MPLIFSLVGYHPQKDHLVAEYDIPRSRVTAVMHIVGIEPNHRGPLVAYPLSNAQVREITNLLKIKVDPTLDFFFETYADEKAHA